MVGPVTRWLNAICARCSPARCASGARALTARKTGYANRAPNATTTAVTWIHRTTS